MPATVTKCPFSKLECRECPLYRGRHGYIVAKEGEETPTGRVLKKDDGDWQEKFKEALGRKV
jgi:hypothetical protein